MREEQMNKFDRIIWRINGVLILCISVAAGVFLFSLLLDQFEYRFRNSNGGTVINVNEATQKEEILYLGSFSKITGRDLYISPLNAALKNESYEFKGSGSSVRNYLYYNYTDSTSRWLLESNNWLIEAKHSIYRNNNDKEKIVIGFLYEIVKKDTDGNGSLNQSDNESVYYSKYDGTDLVVVLEDTTDILGFDQVDNDKSVVFHRNDKGSQSVVVDNSTGRIVVKSDLIAPVGSPNIP
jgi:hypothetical protein